MNSYDNTKIMYDHCSENLQVEMSKGYNEVQKWKNSPTDFDFESTTESSVKNSTMKNGSTKFDIKLHPWET